ncbi:MAG: hypothetical protein A2939_01430 [Parcubacteria group bacterium RIFCSPLOWO2_01_FULL_48_18]|nr:MAG: hypothetical protein A2939_01430 [Parcubacteria group bacterium RIFCSPLOWO2_01_FULL_48_18]OHB22132.1 MAG: hypothetical protein A3J67_04400 [Parcubacteria group bacterium RIFCSPHIGHO2_02_FULL_48_10b]
MPDQGKRILVVEDDTAYRKALVKKFLSEGFNVQEAEDGEKGLASALQEHPDLILMDVIMPKVDGLTMTRRLREDEWGKNARILYLTSLESDEKIMNQLLENRPAYYLIKTAWTLDDIVDRVRSLLDTNIE